MLKRLIYLVLVVGLVFILAACSSLQLSGTWLNTQNALAQTKTNPSLADQLAAGTLKLESTNQAVTAAQAQALLPLWKALKSLSTSNNASPAELQALYRQIQESMTPEQIKAIQDLSLSQADLQALFQQYGLQAGGAGSSGTRALPTRSAQSAANQSGMVPGGLDGGMPPDAGLLGGNPGGAANVPAGTQATPQANRSPSGGANSLLVDVLIQLLEQRAQA